MEKIKWNDVPKSMKPKPLKKGEFAIYELIGIGQNPMAKDRIELEIPNMKGIRNKDRILVGSGEDARAVDIGYIIGYGQGDQPKFGTITWLKSMAGMLRVSTDNAAGLAMYEYLELCNFNESNPNRDTTIGAIFKRKDFKAELEEKRSKRKDLEDAILASRKLTETEVLKLAMGLNITGEDKDEIRGKVEDFAFSKPETFLSMMENKDLDIKEIGMAALKAKLITIDNQARKILSQSGEVVTTWPPEADVDWKDKFVAAVKTDEGQKFFKELKEQLKIKK